MRLDDEATVNFVMRYRRHIGRENQKLIAPALQRAFDQEELETIG